MSDEPTAKFDDGVHLYDVELLTLGLLWHGFHNGVKEWDGDRVLRYWKFILIVFKATNDHNYGKEAVNLLVQYNYMFSEREKAQLLWSRFINTRGYPGANIPCDLFMEHLNRRLKTVIRAMKANVKPSMIKKAGKAIASVNQVCEQFQQQTSSSIRSNRHPYPNFGKDLEMILNTLVEEEVFIPHSARQHRSFNHNCGLMEKLSRTELLKKVEKTMQQILFRWFSLYVYYSVPQV